LSVINPKTTALNPGAPGTALAGEEFRKIEVKRVTNMIKALLRVRTNLPFSGKMVLIHQW
jgi:hypothetical protein